MAKEAKAALIEAYKKMDSKGRAQATRDLMEIISRRKPVGSKPKQLC